MAVKTDFKTFARHELEAKVIDFNNPECIDCAECCSMGSLITEEEYLSLKRFLSKNKRGQDIYRRAVKVIQEHLRQHTLYWLCPFSRPDKRCAIYNKRPQICRDFHCKAELRSPDYDKSTQPHTIFDLFKKGFKK